MSAENEPFVIPASELPDAESAGPAEAPPPPEPDPQDTAMMTVTRMAARPRSSWARWFWSVLVSLLTLVISISAYDYVTSLLGRFPALGMVALVLTGVLALLVLFQIFRELMAFRRLARIDGFHKDAAAALGNEDREAAETVSKQLEQFYAGRDDVRWGRRDLAEKRDGILDADAVLDLTERTLFAPLDAQAQREIEGAARAVAGVTALVPLALADVLAALSLNLRMIRKIAQIYGAHAGFFGSWKLLRSVATHLLATGLVAVGDDMLGSIAGGGALSKVSRKFGEGVINGALTVRVGIAAMEVCRPLPFSELPRPGVSGTLSRALRGMLPQKAD